jgi:hypothetical protein
MIDRQSPLQVSVLPNRGDQSWRVLGICFALAALTFAVFGQTLTHEFVNFDDPDYVYDNPIVAAGVTPQGIEWAFTHVHSDNWHPLTWISHELDCQLYGLHPAGHHLTNVLLHIATVIALFLVLRQTTGSLWRGAFVAAVFAIHPLRVESVACVRLLCAPSVVGCSLWAGGGFVCNGSNVQADASDAARDPLVAGLLAVATVGRDFLLRRAFGAQAVKP